MAERQHPLLTQYRADWVAAGRRLPLEVSRSRYDERVRSWEVLWWENPLTETGGCQSPIAEFDNWAEAQQWAIRAARTHKKADPMPEGRPAEGVGVSDTVARNKN